MTLKQTLFQKGNDCGKGRPKGSLNNTTKNALQLKKLAAERYEEAFSMLWDAMESKEPWAYNLYFKELVPKRVYSDTVFIERPTRQEGDSNPLNLRLNAIIKRLEDFEELTHEQALNEIKVLGNLKLEGSLQQDESDFNICELLSDNELQSLKDKSTNLVKQR